MLIVRDQPTIYSTLGIITIPGTDFTCFSLEDVVRGLGFKIYGQTAIPEGRHKGILTHSPRFGRVLPLIYNQKDFTLTDGRGVKFSGIRVHNGRNHKNSEGCVLAGYQRGQDSIWEPAADDLTKVLLDLHGLGNPFDVEIINRQSA